MKPIDPEKWDRIFTQEDERAWRDEVEQRARRIPVKDLLKPARNGGYICPLCGSGSKANGTGAVEIRKNNKWFCHACKNEQLNNHSGDALDLMRLDSFAADFSTVLNEAAGRVGLTREQYADELARRRKRKREQAEQKAAQEQAQEPPQEQPQESTEAPQDATGAPEKAAADNLPAYKGKEPKAADNKAMNENITFQPDEIIDYTSFYKRCAALLPNSPGEEYLNGRGISTETARRFWVGYAPAWVSPAAIRNHPEWNGWTPPGRQGLILPASKNCYVFRAIHDDDTDNKGRPLPKKMQENGGGEMAMFNEKAMVEALAQDEERVIFVCEGIMNALSIAEAGGVAVATNSAANAEHFALRVHGAQCFANSHGHNVIFALCYDSDDGGDGGAEKIKRSFTHYKIKHFTADILDGQNDANDALKADREKFVAAVQDAITNAAQYAEQEEQKAQEEQQAQEMQEAQEPADIMAAFLEKIQTDAYKPVKTGQRFLDSMLGGGILNQSLLLLMAAPAAGKTMMCQAWGEAMAEAGHRVIYLNFEMSREQMLSRSIAARLYKSRRMKLTSEDILQGYRWTDEQRKAITAEINDYAEHVAPYMEYWTEGPDIEGTLQRLEQKATAAVERGEKAPVIFVDYLHLLQSSEHLDAQDTIKQAMVKFKQFAVDYNTVVIMISAINRDSMKAGKITLDAGRDSSALEFSADYSVSLNYWLIDQNVIKPNDVEALGEVQRQEYRHMILRVLKRRMGPVGRYARVYFLPAQSMFFAEDDFILVDADKNGLTVGRLPDAPPTFEEIRKEWREKMKEREREYGDSTPRRKNEKPAKTEREQDDRE